MASGELGTPPRRGLPWYNRDGFDTWVRGTFGVCLFGVLIGLGALWVRATAVLFDIGGKAGVILPVFVYVALIGFLMALDTATHVERKPLIAVTVLVLFSPLLWGALSVIRWAWMNPLF